MRTISACLSIALLGLPIAGCGDLTVNTPARPRVVIEEKPSSPVIIEKTTVEKPVIIEKKVIIEKH